MNLSYFGNNQIIENYFDSSGNRFNAAFTIENIESRPWGLQIFNRWGATVYENEHYRND